MSELYTLPITIVSCAFLFPLNQMHVSANLVNTVINSSMRAQVILVASQIGSTREKKVIPRFEVVGGVDLFPKSKISLLGILLRLLRLEESVFFKLRSWIPFLFKILVIIWREEEGSRDLPRRGRGVLKKEGFLFLKQWGPAKSS